MADNNKTVDELRSTINSDMDNIGMTTPNDRPTNRIKNPLVSAWSDYLGWIEESDYAKTGLTAQALKQCIDDIKSLLNTVIDYIDAKSVNVFSGRMVYEQPVYEDIAEYTGNPVVVNNSININTLTKPGVFRVGKSEEIQFDSAFRPPVMNDYSTGYLTVFNMDKDSAETGIHIRQIYYPDNSSEGSPMTRVCDNGEWSAWEGMGGGLRRVVVTADTPGVAAETYAQQNVMHESFDDYILTLPDPETVVVGTKIGLEQYSGKGEVRTHDNKYTQVTEPSVHFDSITGSTVNNGKVYLFECCYDESGNKEWVMDYDHCESNAISKLSDKVNVLRETSGRKVQYYESTISTSMTNIKLVSSEQDYAISTQFNLFYYDQYLNLVLDADKLVVTFPKIENVSDVIKVDFDITTHMAKKSLVFIDEAVDADAPDSHLEYTIPENISDKVHVTVTGYAEASADGAKTMRWGVGYYTK